MKTLLNWSSGKDAALSYYKLLQGENYDVVSLLTTVNKENDRIVMHGVREELLDAQAARMSIDYKKVILPAKPTDDAYKEVMSKALAEQKQAGVEAAAFGDIFLEDLKKYREAQLASVDIKAVFPLWGTSTTELIKEVVDVGIEAMVVCVDGSKLGSEFLGRTIDESFLNGLPKDVDPCGENGEFHTFVYNTPYFSSPIAIEKGEVVKKSYETNGVWSAGFYFLDIYEKK